MSTIKLVAGAQNAFTACMTTELNALANGNAIMATNAIANDTNADLEAEFSFTTGASITPTAGGFMGLFLYPLNGDGSTYGDGRFGSSAAGPPPANYYAGFCGLPAAAGVQTGMFSIPFAPFRLTLPRGAFKPVFYNGSGAAMSLGNNILYFRSTNRTVI